MSVCSLLLQLNCQEGYIVKADCSGQLFKNKESFLDPFLSSYRLSYKYERTAPLLKEVLNGLWNLPSLAAGIFYTALYWLLGAPATVSLTLHESGGLAYSVHFSGATAYSICIFNGFWETDVIVNTTHTYVELLELLGQAVANRR